MSTRPLVVWASVPPARMAPASVGPTGTAAAGSALRADSSEAGRWRLRRSAQRPTRAMTVMASRRARASSGVTAARWITRRPPMA